MYVVSLGATIKKIIPKYKEKSKYFLQNINKLSRINIYKRTAFLTEIL